MISCQRATELICRRSDEQLSAREHVELRLHLFLCDFCDKFQKQIAVIRAALRYKEEGSSDVPTDSAFRLSVEAKGRLKEKLKIRSPGG